MNSEFDYGLWSAVLLNVLFFSFFIYSFLRPTKKAEWRSMGVVQAFIVALFTEMYGFPLTIYLLSSVFRVQFPVLNPFGHTNGHLLATFGVGASLYQVVCQIGNLLMMGGLLVMGIGWRKIHGANGRLVTDGIYRYVRHPQYTGIFMVIAGMLVQWPTIITLLMAPILVVVYVRLARREEHDMIELFGKDYLHYRDNTPAFVPFIGVNRRLQSSGVSQKNP